MSLHIVILAAGQGKRMHSKLPKVLHELAGKPLLQHVIETACRLQPEAIHVVIGHQREAIRQAVTMQPVRCVVQEEQLGTGHAVLQVIPEIPDSSRVLILSADVPLIQFETLNDCIHTKDGPEHFLNLITANVVEPMGLGRIVRDPTGAIKFIVEERDATESQRAIKEIYSGICCAMAHDLKRWLPKLANRNAQGEYYLTEIVALATAEQMPIIATQADPIEIQGVNNRMQLQTLERAYQIRIANQLMHNGVTLADAARLDVRGELHCGQDVFIDVNAVFEGRVVIGEGTRIGANCVLSNVVVGENCRILPNSVLDQCSIGNGCDIGPFARIRPGTELADSCKVGNFVEMKNTIMGENSKASHLSYLGDVVMGKDVNVGAGTITCNYDGAYKHKTVIGDGVFIGSDTQLVAPVSVGDHATIGAGSTIRSDVPGGELTLTVSNQKTVSGWKRPKKKESE